MYIKQNHHIINSNIVKIKQYLTIFFFCFKINKQSAFNERPLRPPTINPTLIEHLKRLLQTIIL